ncbi:hypothetical protein OAO87_00705 [bacterium]|nr:hypothetical protein [bacterium]
MARNGGPCRRLLTTAAALCFLEPQRTRWQVSAECTAARPLPPPVLYHPGLRQCCTIPPQVSLLSGKQPQLAALDGPRSPGHRAGCLGAIVRTSLAPRPMANARVKSRH